MYFPPAAHPDLGPSLPPFDRHRSIEIIDNTKVKEVKDANQMTPDELRALADKKEEEAKIIETGTLRHNFYLPATNQVNYNFRSDDPTHFVSEVRKNELIQEFSNRFQLVLEKDTLFHCRIIDGVKLWFDVPGKMSGMSCDWAKKHLDKF